MEESELKTIKDLLLEIEEGPNIGRMADIAVMLTGYYARLAEEFKDIEVFRADGWLKLRETTKSDTMAEKLWLNTEQGRKWNDLRIKQKYIEKTISSIKLRLRVAENESRGSY